MNGSFDLMAITAWSGISQRTSSHFISMLDKEHRDPQPAWPQGACNKPLTSQKCTSQKVTLGEIPSRQTHSTGLQAQDEGVLFLEKLREGRELAGWVTAQRPCCFQENTGPHVRPITQPELPGTQS